MNLQQILSQTKTPYIIECGHDLLASCDIADIAIDSRRIAKENTAIFFALNGKTQNGAQFVPSAVEKGARVIVSEQSFNIPNVVCIKTTQVFHLLVECLKIFYKPLPSNIYAVTGTNGKTSTAEFTRQILQFLGKKAASIGTLGVICETPLQPALTSFDLTTPDIVSLYKNLNVLKRNDVDDVAIEVSSIGLEQARVAGLRIDVGAFTNFTQDHLDYHKSMDEYFFCKMLLFEAVMPDRSAVVLNADIPEFVKIKRMCLAKKHHILEYGHKAQDLKLLEVKQNKDGQLVKFEVAGRHCQVYLTVAGEFQAMNMLCALGMVMAKNVFDIEKVLPRFSQLHPAAGRMQRVALLNNDAQIFIDFAHTPDALNNVLKLARSLTDARLLVLFGCGGDRDNKKRSLMGEVASSLADLVIVTDDNPRTEDAVKIRQEILSTCDKTKTVEIADRKIAIAKALEMLHPRDILVLAGKGHEKYQIIGKEKFEFDEEKIVKNLL